MWRSDVVMQKILSQALTARSSHFVLCIVQVFAWVFFQLKKYISLVKKMVGEMCGAKFNGFQVQKNIAELWSGEKTVFILHLLQSETFTEEIQFPNILCR